MQNFVYIETFGCAANQNNSEIMRGLLKQAGYELTNNQEIADIIIINTCIVKEKTQNKIISRIKNLPTSKLIIVSGCMPETNFKEIQNLNKNLIFLGTHHFKDIIKLIKDFKENKLTAKQQLEYLTQRQEEKLILPKISNNKIISIIQITEGCLGECSYCKVKFAKHKLFSYDENNIIKQAENDLQQGAKEIWITSQDNASYGLDKDNKSKLPELLNKILNLNHRFKLRLGMMNPNNLLPIINEIIEIYKNPKIYKFLHIPIQSASDKVLADMKRKYKIKQVENIINKFKQEIPDITISTDIIIGYPTETEQDFQENLKFIKENQINVLNISRFSNHKELNLNLKPLKKQTINKRNKEIMSLFRKITQQNKEKYLNKNLKVLINKKLSENLYEARDDNYNLIIINSEDKSILGKSIDVNIKQTGVLQMLGKIVN